MSTDEETITRTLAAYHAAMVGARVDDLAGLVTEAFSLRHITGYVQPKDEWFAVIRSGDFDYHHIALEQGSLRIGPENEKGDRSVSGRGVFDATIQGMRRPWRLAFDMRFVRLDDGWHVAQARYTSY